MIVNTACELSLLDPEAAAKVNNYFAKTEELLRELIEQGQAAGEISKSATRRSFLNICSMR